ncbi:MAG: hypothetical protein AAF495_11750 [Pseudomonadota bacterium]
MRKVVFGALALALTGLAAPVSAQPTGLEAGAVEFARGGPDRGAGETDPFRELRQQNKSKGKSKNAEG